MVGYCAIHNRVHIFSPSQSFSTASPRSVLLHQPRICYRTELQISCVAHRDRKKKKALFIKKKQEQRLESFSQKTSCNQKILQLLLISMVYNSLFTNPYQYLFWSILLYQIQKITQLRSHGQGKVT